MSGEQKFLSRQRVVDIMYNPSIMALFKDKPEFLRCWVARQQLILMIVGMQSAAELFDDDDWENLHDLAEYPDEGNVETYLKMEDQLGKIYKTNLSETLYDTPELREVDDSNKKLLRSLKRMRAIGSTLSTTEWEMLKKESTGAEKVKDTIPKSEHVSKTVKENRNNSSNRLVNNHLPEVYNQFTPRHIRTSGGMFIGNLHSSGGRIVNRQYDSSSRGIRQDYACVDGIVDTDGGFAIMNAIADNNGSIVNEHVLQSHGLESHAEKARCHVLPFDSLGNSYYEDDDRTLVPGDVL